MPVQTPKFTISRKEAADLLDVSTRTIDRYIRSKRLSARKKGGNIMLSEEELNHLKVGKFQKMHGASPSGPGRAHRHVNNTGVEELEETMDAQKIFDAATGKVEEKAANKEEKAMLAGGAREQVFEELYDLSRREIREYHNKLEAANYRLGQMETQLKHSVPLLDYKEQTESLKEHEELVTGKMARQGETIDMLEQEIKGERLNKNIYIGLLFGLLALQPLLWLLLQS